MAMDGSRVVSGSGDRPWSVECGDGALAHPRGRSVGDSVAMDGSRVVSGSHDKTVKVWNVETGSSCTPSRAF